MTDDARERGSSGDASPKKTRWAAEREEVRAAVAEERRQARESRAEQDRRIEQEYYNPAAFWVGLLVLLALLGIGWFVVDSMRCDPFYSDSAMVRDRACR
jgi:hypothetical protein